MTNSLKKTCGKISADSQSKHVLEKCWAEKDLISSRINRKGLHYAMEGYIQNFKIHTDFKQAVWSTLHLFLVPLWLGKRDEIYPILQPLGIPTVHVTWTPCTSFDHFYFFWRKQHKSTLKLLFYVSYCCFQWSCPSRCPSIVEAVMSLAHLRSKGGA